MQIKLNLTVFKIFSYIQVPANILLIFSGVYTLFVPTGATIDVFLEIIFISGTILNSIYLFISHFHLRYKHNKNAGKVNWFLSGHLLSWFFLVISNLINIFMNSLIMDTESVYLTVTLFLSTLMTFMTHGLMIGAIFLLISFFRKGDKRTNDILSQMPIRDNSYFEARPNIWKVMKGIGFVLLAFIFIIGVYIPAVFIPGGADVQAYIAGNLSILLLFLLVFATLAVLRLLPRSKKKSHVALTSGFVLFSIILCTVNSLPLVHTYNTVNNLDHQFINEFGDNWESQIPVDLQVKFRQSPIFIKDVFFTLKTPEVEQVLDIDYTFHKGNWLKFDWYAPLGISETSDLLPVIIALHPGSWQFYDKGVTNMFQVSRYLANQGYVVVDVSYGLYPEYTVQDMILQIGNLTKFLETNANQYHTNLSSTFFLGRSAGAHLSLVSGLGYNNSYWNGNFSAVVECKGIIQYYGPTDLSEDFFLPLIGVNETFFSNYNPIDLVSSSSPPIISFQGTSDTLVEPGEASSLHQKMLANDRITILGLMPYAGHAFDSFYGYFHNQVSIYFMERFLALTN